MQDSVIIISPLRNRLTSRGYTPAYLATVWGRFGGGFTAAFAGSKPEQAACFAAEQVRRYGGPRRRKGITYGYDLIAPKEVCELLPDSMRARTMYAALSKPATA